MTRFSGWRVRAACHPRALALAGLCATLALVGALASAGVASATSAAGSAGALFADSPAQQAIALDSPAVVRIVSVVNASLVCATCASDGSDIRSPSSGEYTYYSSGSGAFISPTGAILTADHVVDHSVSNAEDVAFVEQQAAQDIATRYNGSSDQALQYLQNNPGKVTITFTVAFQKAFLSTAYTGNLPDIQHIYAFPIASVLASSPLAKQDTAIVQIDTSGITPGPDFPYLTLANRPVSALDNVTAIAFPADADLALNNADFTSLASVSGSDVNTINSLLSPSANSGTITKANEIRPDGTPVYEASSIASNGSSGGPVINDHGEVIGFVDAGPATDRLTFIIPSAVAPDLSGAGRHRQRASGSLHGAVDGGDGAVLQRVYLPLDASRQRADRAQDAVSSLWRRRAVSGAGEATGDKRDVHGGRRVVRHHHRRCRRGAGADRRLHRGRDRADPGHHLPVDRADPPPQAPTVCHGLRRAHRRHAGDRSAGATAARHAALSGGDALLPQWPRGGRDGRQLLSGLRRAAKWIARLGVETAPGSPSRRRDHRAGRGVILVEAHCTCGAGASADQGGFDDAAARPGGLADSGALGGGRGRRAGDGELADARGAARARACAARERGALSVDRGNDPLYGAWTWRADAAAARSLPWLLFL